MKNCVSRVLCFIVASVLIVSCFALPFSALSPVDPDVFNSYWQYRDYIETHKLPENFQYYEYYSFLGRFKLFSIYHTRSYSYRLVDDVGYELLFSVASHVSPAVPEVTSYPLQDDGREDLRTHSSRESGYLILDNLTYWYKNGDLYKVEWFFNGHRLSLSLSPDYPIVASETAAARLLSRSKATSVFSDFDLDRPYRADYGVATSYDAYLSWLEKTDVPKGFYIYEDFSFLGEFVAFWYSVDFSSENRVYSYVLRKSNEESYTVHILPPSDKLPSEGATVLDSVPEQLAAFGGSSVGTYAVFVGDYCYRCYHHYSYSSFESIRWSADSCRIQIHPEISEYDQIENPLFLPQQAESVLNQIPRSGSFGKSSESVSEGDTPQASEEAENQSLWLVFLGGAALLIVGGAVTAIIFFKRKKA